MSFMILLQLTFAEFVRDVFDQLEPSWFPTFLDTADFSVYFQAAWVASKVSAANFVHLLQDLILLRPLYNWVHLPGMFPPQYSPTLNALNYYALGPGIGGIGQNLWTGFGNGMFLSFPTNPAQIYSIAALFIWGVPAASFALAGCIVGQLFGFVPILLGWEKWFQLWQTYESLPVLVNMVCTAFLSVHLFTVVPSLNSITWTQKRMLSQRFWICVFGSLVNMGSILPYFENLSSSLGGTEYQAGDLVVPFLYDINMLLYWLGLGLGLVFWGGVYGLGLYGLRYVILYVQTPTARAQGLPRVVKTRESVYFWAQSSCAILMSLGSIYAVTWVGTDAITYGNLGFLYKDRAIPEVKRPATMWISRQWNNPLSEPETMDLEAEDYDKILDDWIYWYPFRYDLFPYNDDFCVNDPLHQWQDENTVDEMWINYDVGGRFFDDEEDENEFIRELRFTTGNMVEKLFFSLDTDRSENQDNVDVFGNQTRTSRWHGRIGDAVTFNPLKLFYNDYYLPRLNRENVHVGDFTDVHSFLGEIMRGIFRYDTTVAQIDRNTVEDVDSDDFEVINIKDWRVRYRNNWFYKIPHPSTYWAKTKFRSHNRHQLNVNQSYDVATRRGMLMNYLDFVNRWHTDVDARVNLSPQSMPKRAYNHQFRGNVNLIATWECLDVNYAQRYELARYKTMSYKHKGRRFGKSRAEPWYDIAQRLHRPWYKDKNGAHQSGGRRVGQGPGPHTPPYDYKLVPSMLDTNSVVTFDIPTWNSYPMEAKHALHEELWPLVEEEIQAEKLLVEPFEGFDEMTGMGYMPQEEGQGENRVFNPMNPEDNAKHISEGSSGPSRYGPYEPRTNHEPPMYGEKVALIEEWFLPKEKHRQATLDHFQRRNVDPAPMYIGWDENKQKMLVRQAHVPNFIHTNATVNAPYVEASSDEASVPATDLHESQPRKSQGKRRKPTWFHFAAWAPNGLHIPSKRATYRTYDLHATTMELQRFSNSYDMLDPLQAFDVMEETWLQGPEDDTPKLRQREDVLNQDVMTEWKETLETDGISLSDKEEEDVQQSTVIQNLDFQLRRLYRLRQNKLDTTFATQDVLGWTSRSGGFRGSWSTLKRLPQADFTPLVSELEINYHDDADPLGHVIHEYAHIGYLLPPGLGGVAWPGSYDTRILPHGMRDKNLSSFYRAGFNDMVSTQVNYVLDSKEFDLRGIVDAYDVGVFRRNWEDDLQYFENPHEETENWHLAPAEFERLYDAYHKAKHSKSKRQSFISHPPETNAPQSATACDEQALDEEAPCVTSNGNFAEEASASGSSSKTSGSNGESSHPAADAPGKGPAADAPGKDPAADAPGKGPAADASSQGPTTVEDEPRSAPIDPSHVENAPLGSNLGSNPELESNGENQADPDVSEDESKHT